MKHEIDLKGKNIYTDLVVEQVNQELENIQVDNNKSNKVTTITIDETLSKELNKKEGTYITIEFDDITDIDNREELGRTLEENIKNLLNIEDIKDTDSCLVIGLGNENSTPDALGSLVVKNILVTRHLAILSSLKNGIRTVSAITPNVMANTGIESYDIIRGIISTTNPNFIIIVDSLKASSIERINKTIQLTNTGINPGSGVGNNRMEISKETLNIPVISIGVPTVVDSSTIVSNTISYLFKHLSYIKENEAINKLVISRKNYIDKLKNTNLSDKEKEEVFGILGTLNEDKQRSLIKEVLTNLDYDLIVTPKDIDYVINKLGEVVAFSINNSLSKEINNY